MVWKINFPEEHKLDKTLTCCNVGLNIAPKSMYVQESIFLFSLYLNSHIALVKS